MIPADVRLTACKDLFINQATLTGAFFPVEKNRHPSSPPLPPFLNGTTSLLWVQVSLAEQVWAWSSRLALKPNSASSLAV